MIAEEERSSGSKGDETQEPRGWQKWWARVSGLVKGTAAAIITLGAVVTALQGFPVLSTWFKGDSNPPVSAEAARSVGEEFVRLLMHDGASPSIVRELIHTPYCSNRRTENVDEVVAELNAHTKGLSVISSVVVTVRAYLESGPEIKLSDFRLCLGLRLAKPSDYVVSVLTRRPVGDARGSTGEALARRDEKTTSFC